MTLPVKSLSEIEVKSEVSADDKILILDSVSEEARLASKDELKWDKWDDWEPWTPWAAATVTVWTTSTLPAWSSATVSNTGTSSAAVFNFGIPKWDKGDQGVPWADWDDGQDWNWITSVTSSKVWKTTTVTMNFDEWDPFSFQVQDWADWRWAGDVVWPNSSTNGNVALFDGTTWKLLKDSGSSLGTAASKNTWTSSWNVPVLDANWKLDTTVLPWVALTDTFTVTNKSDLTSLSTAQQWDIGIVTAESKTYVLSADPYSTAANWKELLTPTDAVTSVNSKTWAVTLDADDISDSTTTNKFVTATDKSTWSGKQDALTLPATPTQWHLVTWWANNKSLTDWWAVPTVPTNVSSFVNDAGYLTSETVVSGDSGTTYTIKVANSDPTSWTPATTITFVTA